MVENTGETYIGGNNVIELFNVEIYEHCILDLVTGKKKFSKEKKLDRKRKGSFYNDGLYFRGSGHFFALYSTISGPMMYYLGTSYVLKPELHICVNKMGEWREFVIAEYNICIKYRTSIYIGFDVWSEEEDVDLFYQIEQSYKKEEYYRKYTIDLV